MTGLGPVPTAELQRRQGILEPQGLSALMDREWIDDDAGRAYLALMLDKAPPKPGVATAPQPVTPQYANPAQHRSVAGETPGI